MILQSPGLARSRDKLNTIYLHLQKTHDTKLGKVLTYLETPLPLKLHGPLIMWSMLGHLIIWKSYIYFTRLTNLGKMLSYRRMFCTQLFKLSPTSCFQPNTLWCWILEANKKQFSLKRCSLKIRTDSINQILSNKESMKLVT